MTTTHKDYPPTKSTASSAASRPATSASPASASGGKARPVERSTCGRSAEKWQASPREKKKSQHLDANRLPLARWTWARKSKIRQKKQDQYKAHCKGSR